MTVLPNKYLVLLFFLFFSHLASGQVTEKQSIFKTRANPFIHVTVVDKETGSRMEGAAVFLSYKTDTLKTVTNKNGAATFAAHPFGKADTVVVDISFLGYKKIRHLQAVKPDTFLEAMMEEDPQQLNAIIVKDDHIAMVRHGDTTVYNAAAFTTMEGDRLVELLKKLPGITVSKSGVSAYGEPVSKILINGIMLFNSDIKAALEMVESEDVKKVRVYDEYAQDRLVERDTLGRKERVVDVETKRPFTKAQELVLLALGGVYVDNNADVADGFGGAEANWRSFEKDKPSYVLNAGLGHNYYTSGENTISRYPVDNAYAEFRVENRKQFKSRMSHMLDIALGKGSDESFSTDVYSPTASFQARTDTQTDENSNKTLQAQYMGSQGITVKKNSSFDFRWNFSYSRNDRLGMSNMLSSTDGKDFVENRRSTSLSDRYGFGAKVDFDHHFDKQGRMISVGLDYQGHVGNGDGERVDTMKTSTSEQWLTIGDDNRQNNFGFNAGYDEPLVGENFRLNVSYRLDADFSETRKMAFDELLKQTDVINTQDFTYRNINNTASVGLRLNTADRSLSIMADARYVRSDQLRDERFPASYRQPLAYEQLSPWLSLNYMKNAFSLNVGYSEAVIIPSLEQTRGVIDNSSALYLRAGNPGLDASTSRTASVRLSLGSMKSASSWSLSASYTNNSDVIVSRTVYFGQDTYLPEYGYTAKAGSQLSTPVNAGNASSVSATVGWSGYPSSIKSSLFADIHYGFSSRPFMYGDCLQKNASHSLDLSLNFISGFSRYFELSVFSTTSIGRELLDGGILYDSFTENLTAQARGNFLKHFWVGTDFTYFVERTTMEDLGYDRIKWDMSLTYKFGKKNRSELTLACIDILNKVNSTEINVYDNYIRTAYKTIFGRGIYLSFKYTFK